MGGTGLLGRVLRPARCGGVLFHGLGRRLLVALPTVSAAVLGSLQWLSTRSLPLEPDTLHYMKLARSLELTNLTTMSREPLWPLLLSLPVHVVGPLPDIPRLAGVVGFVALVLVFQLAAVRLIGFISGSAVALLLAFSPWLVYQSARGYREESSAALVLLICLLVSARHWSQMKALGIGFLIGATALLRWDTLTLVGPVLVVAVALKRIPGRYAAIAAAISILMVTPLLVGNWMRFGDPMYFSNVHAAWFRNIEFRDQPGYPTSEELKSDAFAGSRITWGQYLFQLHSPLETLKRAAWGVAAIPYGTTSLALFRPLGRPVPPEQAFSSVSSFLRATLPGLVVLAGMIGGVLLLTGAYWPFGLVLFLAVVEFSPIAALFDPRLALSVVPFTLLGAAVTVRTGVTLAMRRGTWPWRSVGTARS